ncbi:uncharacterized protein LOC133848004 [Drosophila sulfurigaster albostrigata]|uniref:uncharacterized protein LOC133848004 n=1 Tax=Drosophila sulfurigaster albostrigata TaxID=89887 RepID=UPI002D21AA75|nr:uncharacterized protein LOC133848004 [Drosophila sulfurigaster albostrigata]XP_062139351.1 uncharacterized protein LOC133848004 [Drosophila sulfurigaster albostrigata]
MTTSLPLPLPLPLLAIAATSAAASAAAASTSMPEEAKTFSDADVAEVRRVVQRILVPCVFVIGLLGNAVSICVLTRKRMRCTTNIYLTALAITDIAYLTFVLILSFQHYDYFKYQCELYWKLYGLMMWLCDACAYISIYIAVCFTIERFIAIRYPLKRQTFCTESLAKKVIAAVALFCLLTTLLTAFEHTYKINWQLMDDANRPCNQTLANVSPTPNPIQTTSSTPPPTTALLQPNEQQQPTATTATNRSGSGNTLRYFEHFDLGSDPGSGSGSGSNNEHIPSRQQRVSRTTSDGEEVNAPATEPTTATTDSLLQLSRARRRLRRSKDNDIDIAIDIHSDSDVNFNYNYNNININSNSIDSAFEFNITHMCENRTVYNNIYSDLGNNELYITIWSLYSMVVFVLLPLLLLATFNCFLILLVHRSKNVRGDLTNASSIRRTKRKSSSGLKGSVSQENRVTITLIAVVLLFIVCQLPWAIYLILTQYVKIEMNIQRIAGNILNFLVAINAAANFFLYCVLSDKYRKTVRELITGYRYRHRHARNNISLYVPHTTTTLNGDGHSSAAAAAAGGGGNLTSYNHNASSRRCRGKAAATGRLIA